MIKILIADDHAVVRQGLKQIVGDASGMEVTGEAVSGPEALSKARTGEWDVLVMDMTMPGLSGFDVLKELKQTRPELPVLILSMHPEDQYAMRLLKAGASGYLTKESAPEELVKAIRKIVTGGKYVGSTLAEKLVFELNTTSSQPLHATLSDREFQVLCLLASGKTVAEIGRMLSLSVKTVSTYHTRLRDKLQLQTNAELVRYALQNNLIE